MESGVHGRRGDRPRLGQGGLQQEGDGDGREDGPGRVGQGQGDAYRHACESEGLGEDAGDQGGAAAQMLSILGGEEGSVSAPVQGNC